MIFDPFEINEDEDQTIEYHGELDPDRNYFNQFSYQLNKNATIILKTPSINMSKGTAMGEKNYLLCTPTLGVFQPT